MDCGSGQPLKKAETAGRSGPFWWRSSRGSGRGGRPAGAVSPGPQQPQWAVLRGLYGAQGPVPGTPSSGAWSAERHSPRPLVPGTLRARWCPTGGQGLPRPATTSRPRGPRQRPGCWPRGLRRRPEPQSFPAEHGQHGAHAPAHPRGSVTGAGSRFAGVA